MKPASGRGNIAGTILLSVLIVLFLLQLINRIFLCTSYNPNMEGMEVTFVSFVQRALDGQLYSNPEVFPYFLNQAPPLYTFIVAKVLSLFNKMPSDLYSIYVTGRIFNLLCNFVLVAIFFQITRRLLKTSLFISIAFSSILFLSFYAHNYAARVDSLKSLFVVSALYFTIRHFEPGNKRYLYLFISALFLAIGAFTKLDAFFYIFLFAPSLFLVKKKRSAAVLSISGVVLVSIGIGIMWLFFGPDFWINAVGGLQQGISLPYFLKYLSRSIFPILLFVVIAGLLFYNRYSLNKSVVFLASLTIMSFILAGGLLLKWGSGPVYFMDFCVIALILGAKLLDQMRKEWQLSILLVVLALLAYDFSRNYDTSRLIFSFRQERIYKERFYFLESIKPRIIKNSNPVIICTVKDLANHLYPNSIFSSFETEYPDHLVCDTTFWGSSPKPVFNYPGGEMCDTAQLYIMSSKCQGLPFILGMSCFSSTPAETMGDIVIYRKP